MIIFLLELIRGRITPHYITARTNKNSVIAIQELFPNKIIKSFELRKSNDHAKRKCTCIWIVVFSPLEEIKQLLHKNGFSKPEDEFNWLVNFFGKRKCI